MTEIMTREEIQQWKKQELLKFFTIYINTYKRFRELPRPKNKEEREKEEIQETPRKKKIQIKNRQGSNREILENVPLNNINKNILIIGTSGTGKSELMRKIEEELQPKLKILFKPDREKSYNINKHRPFIPEDRTNFLEAWRESIKPNNKGYMLIQEEITIQEMRKENQEHQELINEIRHKKEKSSKLDIGIYNMIEDRLKHLFMNRTKEIRKHGKISMEGMTEDEYLFFSDYILRMNYNELLDEIISIDEIHRLTPLMDGLISQITREIRSRGGIIATSQSLSDLPPFLINNFGTIFIFQDIDKRDLEYFEEIDSDLKEDILKLENHEFIELRSYKISKRDGQRYKMELILND